MQFIMCVVFDSIKTMNLKTNADLGAKEDDQLDLVLISAQKEDDQLDLVLISDQKEDDQQDLVP